LPLLTDSVILFQVINSFKNSQTKAVFEGECPRQMGNVLCNAALRKLVLLHAATDINDLRIPPGNRLEVLKGDRKGQNSIRINDRWRLCFRWLNGNAFDVELVDYHKG
jgi:proteic killer suppression protein